MLERIDLRPMISTDNLEEIEKTMKAKRFQASNQQDLRQVAAIIKEGGIAVLPFNGIFGIFGDIDNKDASDRIIQAKERPKNKNLIAVIPPDYAHEIVDFDRVIHPRDKISDIWKKMHAMGIILPARDDTPQHVTKDGTVINIWTEYEPLKMIMEYFRAMGGRGFVGTSANKSDQPTHYNSNEVYKDFQNNVDAVVQDDFSHLASDKKRVNYSFLKKAFHNMTFNRFNRVDRRESTSVIDLTGAKPRLHRSGNVTEDEIRSHLKKAGFPDLVKDRDVIVVNPKK